MRKKNPKHQPSISQLRGVSHPETNRLSSLDSLFSGSYTQDDDVIETLNMISSLIGDNIRTSKDLANFDTHIFKEEASTLLNIRMKYEATLIKDAKDLKLANKIYNKHKRLAVLMN